MKNWKANHKNKKAFYITLLNWKANSKKYENILHKKKKGRKEELPKYKDEVREAETKRNGTAKNIKGNNIK